MSRYKEELEGLARFESEEERLAAAARLDSIWDEEADHAAALDEARKENAEIVAERDALKVERDEYRDKYVNMYFTNPARASEDQRKDIVKDSMHESFNELFNMREGF